LAVTNSRILTTNDSVRLGASSGRTGAVRLDSGTWTASGEEWVADAAELVVPPVLKQPGGFRRHLPLAWIRPGSPPINMLADLVDDRSDIVCECSRILRGLGSR